MRRIALAPILMLLMLSIVTPGRAESNQRCFEKTGICIQGAIRSLWERGGGVAMFGEPTTELTSDTLGGQHYQVQWFEQARFELHPERAAPYTIQLGRIGEELLLARGENWRNGPFSGPQDGCRYFAETGQSVCGDFLAAWRAAGTSDSVRLMVLGYPLTTTRQEPDGLISQWFERVRLERTPAGVVRSRNLSGELRTTSAWKIANATSAAPQVVGANAAVMDWPGSDGKMAMLREGDGRWTCLPDDPTNPRNDPMCLDEMWMKWLNAFMTGTEPEYTRPGIGYMLQDDAAASNSDPSVLAPAPGTSWKSDGPHMMFVFPKSTDLSALPTQAGSGGPWVMWAGTPYQHVMMPIPAVLPSASKNRVTNARSAGPTQLMKAAPVIDWPTGTSPVALPSGKNGWTCIADDPSTPTSNDPLCVDGMWRAWVEALYAGTSPAITRPGFGYHFQGAAFASAADPAAPPPADPAGWMTEPPTVVLVCPQPLNSANYGDQPGDGPWLMWANTPYRHLMIPVR